MVGDVTIFQEIGFLIGIVSGVLFPFTFLTISVFFVVLFFQFTDDLDLLYWETQELLAKIFTPSQARRYAFLFFALAVGTCVLSLSTFVFPEWGWLYLPICCGAALWPVLLVSKWARPHFLKFINYRQEDDEVMPE